MHPIIQISLSKRSTLIARASQMAAVATNPTQKAELQVIAAWPQEDPAFDGRHQAVCPVLPRSQCFGHWEKPNDTDTHYWVQIAPGFGPENAPRWAFLLR